MSVNEVVEQIERVRISASPERNILRESELPPVVIAERYVEGNNTQRGSTTYRYAAGTDPRQNVELKPQVQGHRFAGFVAKNSYWLGAGILTAAAFLLAGLPTAVAYGAFAFAGSQWSTPWRYATLLSIAGLALGTPLILALQIAAAGFYVMTKGIFSK